MQTLSPDQYRVLFESVPGLYLVLTPALDIVAVSDAYLRATMTEREVILGRNIFDVFPDDPSDPHATGVANLRASLERVLTHRRADAMAVQEYPVRTAGGSGEFELRYWSPVNSPVTNAQGGVDFIIHRVEDVTEFIRAKQTESSLALARDEALTRLGTIESEVYRRAQEIQSANRQLRELGADLERRVEERTAELSSANAALEAQIAEREKAEAALLATQAQLHQSQRLDAIGRLAGGVAHDFNNLLSVVIGFGESLLAEPDLSERQRRDIQDIYDAGLRGAALTQQLLKFSRRGVVSGAVLDVNDVARGIESLLRRVLGEDITMSFVLAPGAARVHMDQSELESVLMNLVVNARDAMPDGGKLTVETARVELDEAYARAHLGTTGGSHVLLAVSDTGVGMDAATRERVFEPFFTTKDPGKGTGLGLATVFGVVKHCGGVIWLYSEVGKGTTFKIYLPRADSPVTRPDTAIASEVVGGDETILVVEDDEAVRRVAIGALRDLGYHVLDVGHPLRALELLEMHPERIDVLVTDVVMPEMNGAELALRVRALRPGIRVVFTSGYTGDVVFRHGMLDAEVAFVEKPLSSRALGREVRAVLDAPARGRAP